MRATQAADQTAARSCELDLPRVPLLIGDAADPIVQGEVRGAWTARDAHTLGAILMRTAKSREITAPQQRT